MTRSQISAAHRVSVTLLAAAVGCSSTKQPTAYVRSDSLGIELITYALSFQDDPGVALVLDPEPVLSIADEALSLYRVRMARFQSRGGIVVLNGGGRELMIFDNVGSLLSRAGGPGEGPGEFRHLTYLSIGPGDSLFAYDTRARRVSVFDRHGAFARTVTLQGADTLGQATRIGVLQDGELVGAFFRRTLGSGLVRDSLVVARFHSSGAFGVSVDVFPHSYTHWGPHELPPGGAKSSFPAPVPLSSLTAVSLGDAAIYVGLADRFALMRIDRQGGRRVTRQQEGPKPVTEAHREQLFARLAAAGRAGPEEDLLRGLEGPSTLPNFGDEPLTESYDEALLVTDTDGLWVKPFQLVDSVSTEWLRFDADGLYEGTVQIPTRFRPTAVRKDLVLGVSRDRMDVESVHVFRLIEAAEGR